MIKEDERVEFVGQIMDVFEDFLERKRIKFPETSQLMREAGCSEDEIKENDVVLYGENYSAVSEPIEQILINWNVLEHEK